MSIDANGPISHKGTLARVHSPLILAPNPRRVEPDLILLIILAVADNPSWVGSRPGKYQPMIVRINVVRKGQCC